MDPSEKKSPGVDRSEDARKERRRTQNRQHARNTRLRKRNHIDALEDRIIELQLEGKRMRLLIDEIYTAQSLLGIGGGAKPIAEVKHSSEVCGDAYAQFCEDSNSKNVETFSSYVAIPAGVEEDEKKRIRKERNRLHAKNMRLRRRNFLDVGDVLIAAMENECHQLRSYLITQGYMAQQDSTEAEIRAAEARRELVTLTVSQTNRYVAAPDQRGRKTTGRGVLGYGVPGAGFASVSADQESPSEGVEADLAEIGGGGGGGSSSSPSSSSSRYNAARSAAAGAAMARLGIPPFTFSRGAPFLETKDRGWHSSRSDYFLKNGDNINDDDDDRDENDEERMGGIGGSAGLAVAAAMANYKQVGAQLVAGEHRAACPRLDGSSTGMSSITQEVEVRPSSAAASSAVPVKVKSDRSPALSLAQAAAELKVNPPPYVKYVSLPAAPDGDRSAKHSHTVNPRGSTPTGFALNPADSTPPYVTYVHPKDPALLASGLPMQRDSAAPSSAAYDVSAASGVFREEGEEAAAVAGVNAGGPSKRRKRALRDDMPPELVPLPPYIKYVNAEQQQQQQQQQQHDQHHHHHQQQKQSTASTTVATAADTDMGIDTVTTSLDVLKQLYDQIASTSGVSQEALDALDPLPAIPPLPWGLSTILSGSGAAPSAVVSVLGEEALMNHPEQTSSTSAPPSALDHNALAHSGSTAAIGSNQTSQSMQKPKRCRSQGQAEAAFPPSVSVTSGTFSGSSPSAAMSQMNNTLPSAWSEAWSGTGAAATESTNGGGGGTSMSSSVRDVGGFGAMNLLENAAVEQAPPEAAATATINIAGVAKAAQAAAGIASQTTPRPDGSRRWQSVDSYTDDSNQAETYSESAVKRSGLSLNEAQEKQLLQLYRFYEQQRQIAASSAMFPTKKRRRRRTKLEMKAARELQESGHSGSSVTQSNSRDGSGSESTSSGSGEQFQGPEGSNKVVPHESSTSSGSNPSHSPNPSYSDSKHESANTNGTTSASAITASNSNESMPDNASDQAQPPIHPKKRRHRRTKLQIELDRLRSDPHAGSNGVSRRMQMVGGLGDFPLGLGLGFNPDKDMKSSAGFADFALYLQEMAAAAAGSAATSTSTSGSSSSLSGTAGWAKN